MTNKIINYLIYSSIFVSIASSVLSVIPPIVFDIKISVNKTLLVFFGTLLIYNIDHLKDIKIDKFTNPGRTQFVENYRNYLLVLIVISILASTYLFFKIEFQQTKILIPVFIIGIFHWKLKKNTIFSIIYITLSWTIVIVIFPSIGEIYPKKGLFFTALIFGLTFLANASVFVASEHKSKTISKTVFFAKLITVGGVILASVFGYATIPFMFIPGLTLFALFFYKPTEKYNLFFMDGALLLGGILSVLYKEFFNFL